MGLGARTATVGRAGPPELTVLAFGDRNGTVAPEILGRARKHTLARARYGDLWRQHRLRRDRLRAGAPSSSMPAPEYGRWARRSSTRAEISVDVLFSHCHFDHIEGLPFFTPVYTKGHAIRFWSGHRPGANATRDMIADFLRPPYFPVNPAAFRASVTYRDFRAGDVLDFGDGISAATVLLQPPRRRHRLPHPLRREIRLLHQRRRAPRRRARSRARPVRRRRRCDDL